tara:strand:- start:11341 stop:11628 length:288 start_codon:yes stop_codon:yes gene_type:complete
MITTIIIVSILLVISIFVNVNQLRKQEEHQDYVTELEESNLKYYDFFAMLKTKVSEAHSDIKNVDRLGAFESSDEIGHAFRTIKDVIEDLNKGMQ